jgi:adenine deaminase
VTTPLAGTAFAAGWPSAPTTVPVRPAPDLPVGPAPAPALGRAWAAAAGLLPSEAELARLRRVAVGEEDADLLVHSGTVVVVQTGELLRRDVAIVGRYIAAVTRPGALAGRRSLDATGRYLLPAYVDAHVRPERTLLLPGEAARLLVPRGTVTVLSDTAGLVARCGPRGAALATGSGTPLRVLARRPGAPGPTAADLLPGEQAGGHRALADLVGYGQLGCAVRSGIAAGLSPAEAVRRATLAPARRHGLDRVLGAILPAHLADLLIVTEIGAVEPPDLVVAGGRIAAAQGRPLFDNPDRAPAWSLDTVRLPVNLHLDSFAVAGWPGYPALLPIGVEIVARLSTSVVPARQAGLTGVLPGLPALPGVGGLTTATGPGALPSPSGPASVAKGPAVPPVARTGPVSPAATNGPVSPAATNGPVSPAAKGGPVSPAATSGLVPPAAKGGLVSPAATSGPVPPTASAVSPAAKTGPGSPTARSGPGSLAARSGPGSLAAKSGPAHPGPRNGPVPRQVRVEPAVRNGLIVADPDRDLLKVAVVDRSGGQRPVRVGLLRGVGLTSGAIGVTATEPPGDLVLVGTNDADLLTAARALEGMGGGYVVVDRGWVQAACPLPVAGVLSDAPWEAVEGQLAAADAAAVAIGCRLPSPLQTLADLGTDLYLHP